MKQDQKMTLTLAILDNAGRTLASIEIDNLWYDGSDPDRMDALREQYRIHLDFQDDLK